MDEQTEDTRDEFERFAENYAALSDDTEEADEASAVDDEAERSDEDDDEAADSQDADDDHADPDEDGDDDAPEAGDGERAAGDKPETTDLAKAKRALNQANSELGRLRPLREQVVRGQAEIASTSARLESLAALLEQRDQEILAAWQQAYDGATDPAQRSYYGAELARRQQGFKGDRERLDWQAQQTAAQFNQQATDYLQMQELDSYVRREAPAELARVIAREVKRNGLGKEERARLAALAESSEFRAILASAPPQQAARFIQLKTQELIQTAQTLGKGRAKRNRTEVAEKQTYRQEKATPAAPKGKPTREQIDRKYRNSGDMQGHYAELAKHGYI